MNRFLLLSALSCCLRNEASENPDAGGGAAPTPSAPPAAPPAAPATPPAPAPESQSAAAPTQAPAPTLLDHALAVGRGKAELLASVRDLNAKVGTLTAELAQLKAERDALSEHAAALEVERAQVQNALTAAEAEKKTVEESTTQALAALNIPRPEMPAPASQGVGTKLEQLQSQLESTTDHVQRGRLAAQIWDEMKAGAGKN